MLPARIVAVDHIPLTPNGKTDRKALLALDPGPAAPASTLDARQAPSTPEEELLAGIFAEVLGLEKVGIHDDFFELGGHSLLATQVVSRIRSAFGLDVPVRSLFETPTVAGLARHLAELRRQHDSEETEPPIVPLPRDGTELPLSFAQQRLWFLYRLEPESTAYNISGAMRVRGTLDTDALERSFSEIVRRHESLRTTFHEVDGRPVQRIHAPAPFALPITDLSGLAPEEREAEVRRRAAEEASRPFDLEQGPLFRAELLRLADDEHVLLLGMHHIVSDGWSFGVLTRELGTLYRAFASGEPSPLAELPIQYADFAVWQRSWLQGRTLEGSVLQRQLDYWTRQLDGLATLQLPTDRPRPPVQTYNGDAVALSLPTELARALGRLARQESASLFMMLLAAFKVLLARYAAQDDIVVGSPIAGRNRAEIEHLIGFFLNSLVLRTDLSGEPSFRELLARVRNVTLDAYAHQDVPFEKLVEHIDPPRDPSRTPLFQVMFNMLPDWQRSVTALADLTAE